MNMEWSRGEGAEITQIWNIPSYSWSDLQKMLFSLVSRDQDQETILQCAGTGNIILQVRQSVQ